jgi:DNA-binding protein HU-beta
MAAAAKTISKTQMADLLSQKTGHSKKDSKLFLETLISEVTVQLKKGNTVALTGMGRLTVKKYKARTARNPQTGATIKVPAKKKVRFTVAKDLKEAVL